MVYAGMIAKSAYLGHNSCLHNPKHRDSRTLGLDSKGTCIRTFRLRKDRHHLCRDLELLQQAKSCEFLAPSVNTNDFYINLNRFRKSNGSITTDECLHSSPCLHRRTYLYGFLCKKDWRSFLSAGLSAARHKEADAIKGSEGQRQGGPHPIHTCSQWMLWKGQAKKTTVAD